MIITKEQFVKMTPLERKFHLSRLGLTPKELAKNHRRSKATISYALDGKRKKILNRIAEKVEKVSKELCS